MSPLGRALLSVMDICPDGSVITTAHVALGPFGDYLYFCRLVAMSRVQS